MFEKAFEFSVFVIFRTIFLKNLKSEFLIHIWFGLRVRKVFAFKSFKKNKKSLEVANIVLVFVFFKWSWSVKRLLEGMFLNLFRKWKKLDSNQRELLTNRFTVCRLRPLGHFFKKRLSVLIKKRKYKQKSRKR